MSFIEFPHSGGRLGTPSALLLVPVYRLPATSRKGGPIPIFGKANGLEMQIVVGAYRLEVGSRDRKKYHGSARECSSL
jgi:hypothetical protein